MKIEECLQECRKSGLAGWELVAYVQVSVMKQMKYSYDNPAALPRKAFEQGRGYCVQQAWCTRHILRKLGFKCETVYCPRVQVVGKIFDGKVVEPFLSGHVWNRVTINGVTKDICTTSEDNRPGKVAFQPLASVRPYGPIIAVFGWLGSIPACIIRRKKLNRR